MALGTVMRAIVLQSPGASIPVKIFDQHKLTMCRWSKNYLSFPLSCNLFDQPRKMKNQCSKFFLQFFTLSCHICSILNGISNIVVSRTIHNTLKAMWWKLKYLNYHVRMAPLLKQIESQIGSGPLVISAVWFPPSERVTATSVAQVDNQKIWCESMCHQIVLNWRHIKT